MIYKHKGGYMLHVCFICVLFWFFVVVVVVVFKCNEQIGWEEARERGSQIIDYIL